MGKEREIRRRSESDQTSTISARWDSNAPGFFAFHWKNVGGKDGSSLEALKGVAKFFRKTSLDVRIDDLSFYEPVIRPKLQVPLNTVKEFTRIRNQISYKIELWTKPSGDRASIPEPSEILFNGQEGFVRLVVQNNSPEPVMIDRVKASATSPLKILRFRDSGLVQSRSAQEIVIPFDCPESAAAAFYRAALSFRVRDKGEGVTVREDFSLAVFRLRSRKVQVLSGEGMIGMDLTVDAETPFGQREVVTVRSNLNASFIKGRLRISGQLLSVHATMRFPNSISLQAKLPANLLHTHLFLGLAITARDVFGWLTGALIAAIVGLGAVKGKVALILLINAVAGPGWAIVASIAIGNPSFESFWTTFVVAAGAMAGQDMNKAIYDKITSLFE